MKIRENLIAQILFLVVLLFNVQPAQADEIGQTVVLSVSPLFSIQKQASSVEAASVNPATGVHTGLRLIYDIVTNGTDDDYDVTLSSSIVSQGGLVSAFGNDGSLLFAHETVPPTSGAVSNAKLRIGPNENVIAYPVTTVITSPMTSRYYEGYSTYGSCYAIKLNNATSSTLNFEVGTNPSANTYSAARDLAGSYKSTITFTVTPKL